MHRMVRRYVRRLPLWKIRSRAFAKKLLAWRDRRSLTLEACPQGSGEIRRLNMLHPHIRRIPSQTGRSERTVHRWPNPNFCFD